MDSIGQLGSSNASLSNTPFLYVMVLLHVRVCGVCTGVMVAVCLQLTFLSASISSTLQVDHSGWYEVIGLQVCSMGMVSVVIGLVHMHFNVLKAQYL